MENSINLTICQDCKQNPAVYGDGLTWSRCSACQLKVTQQETKEEKQNEEPIQPQTEEGFPHKIVPGLTSIILPVYMSSYTLFHYTGNCIGSIREHTFNDQYELVVVDNGSPIQPPELTSYYAHRVIKNETNFGVTKAWNQGIRMSVGEYIVLINNDVQVFDHWLEDMKKALDQDGYDLIMAHPMYSLTEPFARALESRDRRIAAINEKRIYSDFRDFSCVMFRRELIDEIGLFDESFVSYCSDSDFIKRMENAHKKWGCVETVATSHISDATGFSIAETPNIMNKDKETYKNKWEAANTPTPKPTILKENVQLVRTPETGDAIYFVKDGTYHHVKDPEALHALGLDFGDETMLEKIPVEWTYGEEIDATNAKNYV